MGAVASEFAKIKEAIIVFAVIGLPTPSKATPRSKANGESLEEKCRKIVGKEVNEGEGRGGASRPQVQLWSDYMMGMPHAR